MKTLFNLISRPLTPTLEPKAGHRRFGRLSTLFLLLPLLVAALATVPARADSSVGTGTGPGNYAPVAMQLPYVTMAGGTSSNLSGGWSIVISATNSSVLYTNGAGGGLPGFYTNTVISSTTNTVYAQANAPYQRYLGLELVFNTSDSTTTSNRVLTLQRSVSGLYYDTANNITWSIPAKGTSQVVGVTNIDMAGFGYLRVANDQWSDSNAGHVLTNQALYYSIKRNAP